MRHLGPPDFGGDSEPASEITPRPRPPHPNSTPAARAPPGPGLSPTHHGSRSDSGLQGPLQYLSNNGFYELGLKVAPSHTPPFPRLLLCILSTRRTPSTYKSRESGNKNPHAALTISSNSQCIATLCFVHPPPPRCCPWVILKEMPSIVNISAHIFKIHTLQNENIKAIPLSHP